MSRLARFKMVAFTLTLYAAGAAGDRVEPHKMTLTPLADGLWMYTGRGQHPDFGTYLYNGVVAIDSAEAVIIDLPENGHDASQLFDWIKQKGATVVYAVPQHWHGDSAGTLATMYERAIPVVMLDKTFELLDADRRGRPEVTFSRAVKLRYGRRYVELAYHGGGHSEDGIVAWFDDGKVLVGGCLLKAADAKSLGNLADADVAHYLSTVSAVKNRYRGARVVTPGHGAPGGVDVIDRTMTLLQGLPPVE